METTMDSADFGELLRQARVRIPITLQELSAHTNISPSHLGRIERGERFPSAGILRKLAKPLGFEEEELFTLAGYLSSVSDASKSTREVYHTLDPYVAKMLGSEPPEVQRAVVGLLAILKSLSRNMNK